jgi:arabinose-5-phosphate isomerase
MGERDCGKNCGCSKPSSTTSPGELDFVRAVLRDEAEVVAALAQRVDERFTKAVDLLCACADGGGTVLVTGLGKSGHIAAKISATMASLGIPSYCVHPTEAAHGDLGRFRPSDCVIAISFSGETEEVVNLVAILRQDGLPVIGITNGRLQAGAEASSLEQLSTVTLTLGINAEAGDGAFVAPTSSTTATLAIGDALSLAAARRRNFTPEEFAKRHPGGTLGDLLRPVTDVMRFVVGKNLPVITQTNSVAEALAAAQQAGRRPGAMMIVDPATGALAGIFTDGDLRRLVLRDTQELSRPMADVMTKKPRTLRDTALVREALLLIREFRQDEIPVVDEKGRPVGILDVQDLIALKLVKD